MIKRTVKQFSIMSIFEELTCFSVLLLVFLVAIAWSGVELCLRK